MDYLAKDIPFELNFCYANTGHEVTFTMEYNDDVRYD